MVKTLIIYCALATSPFKGSMRSLRILTFLPLSSSTANESRFRQQSNKHQASTITFLSFAIMTIKSMVKFNLFSTAC
jgi:hypothetical protein